jgi:hypothetical protein
MSEGSGAEQGIPAHQELAIAFYNAARAEVVQRLALREQTFLAWIGTTGVILGFAATAANNASTNHAGTHHFFEPLLVAMIPILSLPLSLAFYRHQLIIRYLSDYLRGDLRKFLREDQKDAPRHWDNSSALGARIGRFVVIEAAAHTVVLSVVPAACLVYLIWVKGAAFWRLWYWWVGCCFTFGSAFFGVEEWLIVKRTPHDQYWQREETVAKG